MLIKKFSPFIFLSIAYGQNIEEILNIAIQNNYKIKSYQHTIKSKNYAINQAKDGYLPVISIYSSITKEKYTEKYPNNQKYKINDKIISYGINLKQNIYNPKIFASIKDAKLKKQITTLEKDSFILNLYQNVLITYFEVITNKVNLKYYKTQKENYKKILDDITERAKYKYTTNTELYQAKSNYSIASNQYIKAKLQYDNSLRKLKLLLLTNQNFNIQNSIRDNIDEIIKSQLLSYLKYKKLLINNPSLKSAKIYIKVAQNELQNRKYNRYPILDVTASYSNENRKNTTSTKNDYKISLNFSLNLYNKSINDSIQEAKELYLAAQNDYEYKKNSLELDFNKNWDSLQTTLEIIKSDKEKIKQTKEYLLQAKESYKYKLISLSDYYKAENDYFNALINFQNDKLNLIYYYINILSQTNKLKEEVKKLKLFIN